MAVRLHADRSQDAMNLYVRTRATIAIDDIPHATMSAGSHVCPNGEMHELRNTTKMESPSKGTPREDRSTQHHVKDSSTVYTKPNHKEHASMTKVPSSLPSEPASASAVSAVMGPPPPPEDKKASWWERWRRDRREARELGMPSGGSSRRWKVGNVVS